MSKGNVLIVDDDWDSVNVLSQILFNEGYTIDVARHGLEAIERAKEHRHAAAIVDYVMPYFQGDEVARKIKEIDPDAYLILVTGYKIVLHPSVSKYFDRVLEKPLAANELLKALEVIKTPSMTQGLPG